MAAKDRQPAAGDPKRLELALRALDEGFYDWDVARGTIRYSQAVYSVLKMPRDLRSTEDWRRRIHPEDLAAYDAAILAHFRKKTRRFLCDYRFRATDGSWRWARQRGIAMRDKRGRALRLVGTISDVSELKHAEEARRLSDERYAFALRAINEGVYDWDIAAGKTYYSERVVSAVGLSHRQLRSAADWYGRIHPEDRPRYDAAMVAHFKGRTERFECDFRYRARDGSWRWARQHGVALRDASGRAVRMVGSTGNIDELKRAELELRRAHAETAAALERQTATAEILKVISSSPADVTPVFQAILRSATRLCSAERGLVFRYDGELIHCVAGQGLSAEAEREFFSRPVRPSPVSGIGRVIATRKPVQIADVTDDEAYRRGDPLRVRTAKLLGARTAMWLPLLKGDSVIGTFAIYRQEVRPFSGQQIALVQTFADQAVIAIENVRLFNETKEALERQTATAEVLKVIAGSPSDVQPVFEAVAERTTQLCSAMNAVVLIAEGDILRVVSKVGTPEPPFSQLPMRRTLILARAFLDGQTVHVEDVVPLLDGEYPDARENQRRVGFRSFLAVPMKREGKSIGVIGAWRPEVKPFSGAQIDLLETFAAQAVLAIENVRLFNETREALERQTATAEILKVISESPTDIQPVFDTIVRSAVRLCNGLLGTVIRVDGDRLQLAAHYNVSSEGLRAYRETYPMPVSRDTVAGNAILDRRIIDVIDAQDDPAVPPRSVAMARAAGFRGVVAIPLLREGKAIGLLNVSWRERGPASERHLALLKTFADQAVIAIENVRLFNETKEALERQTATAEILKVISSSPTDVQPVFDAIVQSAARLFGRRASLRTVEGGGLVRRARSSEGTQAPETMLINRDSIVGMVALDAKAMQVTDNRGPDAPPFAKLHSHAWDYRSIASAPLVRDGVVIGVITVTSPEPGALSEKQMALLSTFADQAVIAIENVRLFNETREALERQTATAEILNVISRSPTDVQPVFDTIVRSAIRLMDGVSGGLFISDGSQVSVGAAYRAGESTKWSFQDDFPAPIGYNVPAVHAIRESRVLNVADLLESDYPERAKERARLGGYRSALCVPMLRGGSAVGSIAVTRAAPGLFPEHHVTLLKTFADQAVIAIENVRLFKELQRRIEQMTALGEVGQAISATLELETVLKTIVVHAVRLTGLDAGVIYEYDERAEEFQLRASENFDEDGVASLRGAAIRKGEGAVGRSVETREPTQVPDTHAPDYPTRLRELLDPQGFRAILAVPLSREEHVIGALMVIRKAPGPFAPEVVELLKTFATQSALAIQNARLFREIAEKGRQLEVASQHKSQFLASMSHELRTPLNAILGFNEMILDEIYGPLSPEVKAPLQNMQASGKHLLRLINNVLDLAKIEAGRMELALADYSVHDTVESVRSTLTPLAAEKGLELVATLPADLPLAYGDGGRISQCLMNLAGNSLKFTRQGRVEIAVGLNDGGVLRYSVADTGIGIPRDKLDSLFTEFKQTDATIASEYGGTGLGLSITKRFIEMHGGRIWVESEPGKGSTFIFEIPLRAGQ